MALECAMLGVAVGQVNVWGGEFGCWRLKSLPQNAQRLRSLIRFLLRQTVDGACIRLVPQMSMRISATRAAIESSPLYNRDLAPTVLPGEVAAGDRGARTWGTYNYAALWVSMSVNILTYMLAASLIQGGMNWKQAVFTVFLGNCIVLAPMLLNSHPGAQYGIPFPVLARASFGVLGANVAAVLRALVACGWFGIQTWIGGEAVNVLLATVWPAWKSVPHGAGICFLAFWVINLAVILKGIEYIRFSARH